MKTAPQKVSGSKLLAVTALTLGIAVFQSGCAGAKRHPASGEMTPPRFDQGLVAAAEAISNDVGDARFDSATCVDYLRGVSAEIESLSPPQMQGPELHEKALELVQILWNTRLKLHHRLPEFTPECVAQVREFFRLIRFVEDYLAETRLGIKPVDPSKLDFAKIKVPVLEDTPEYLVLRAQGVPHDIGFKPGDLMAARGVSFLSATISRIGDIKSQFSHIILLHVDGVTGKAQTIESYVGKGVGIYELLEALKNENARLLMLRPRDQALGKRADQMMYDRVKSAIDAGHPIPYDYEFDFDNHDRQSCAEVARAAYEEASSGAFIIPFYPSQISSDPAFLRRIGLKQGKSFTPGDIEVDPRFEMIAEFRDLRITRDSRIKDAILTKMLGWMDQYGYVLHETGRSKFAGRFVYDARRSFAWPLVQKVLGIPDFSTEIPRKMFQTVALMNQIGDIFLEHLRKKDAEYEAKTGWPMTLGDLYRELDLFREADLALYRDPATRGKAAFHSIFRGKL